MRKIRLVRKKSIALICFFLVLPGILQAHPGHGYFEDLLIHYVTSITHLVPLVLVVGIVLFFLIKMRLSSGKQP